MTWNSTWLRVGVVRVKGETYPCTRLPENLQAILNQGGLIASLDKDPAEAGSKEAAAEGKSSAEEELRPMTIAEKIVAAAAGKKAVRAGDIETVTLDRLMSNDGTTHLTVGMFESLKHQRIADLSKLVLDHNIPCDSVKTAASQKKMRDFAKKHGITFYEGEGVCHQVMM